MKRPSYLINFDSATAMLEGCANVLQNQGLPMVGMQPAPVAKLLRPVGRGLEQLPDAALETFFARSGAAEAVSPRRLKQVDSEKVARWMVQRYPKRRYPAIAIGSASGALSHLWAALQIPWLPQTYLIGVRRSGIHPDEPELDMQWGKQVAEPLLEANPDLQLHHMHDPNQDRLMATRMAYFRVKRLTLGDAYEQFIREHLEPGGILFIAESRQKWPTVRVGQRHLFQHGAVGGATPDEFLHGGPRVARYLARYGSHRRAWEPPEPDAERTEAEWGFEPRLLDDIDRFAREQGYVVRRMIYGNPEAPSTLVADLYRWWYAQRRIVSKRLLVSSFIMHDPYWALRTGSIPLWMSFNKQPSADMLETYLDDEGPFSEIYLMLFAHGVHSVGLVPIERWLGISARASERGALLGVDPARYPLHLAALPRYYHDLQREIAARYPLPGPLHLDQLEQFLALRGDRYPIRWIDHVHGAAAHAFLPPASDQGLCVQA